MLDAGRHVGAERDQTAFFGGAVRGTPAFNQFFAGMTALGRAGLPDDIGPMIAILPGPANDWVDVQRAH